MSFELDEDELLGTRSCEGYTYTKEEEDALLGGDILELSADYDEFQEESYDESNQINSFGGNSKPEPPISVNFSEENYIQSRQSNYEEDLDYDEDEDHKDSHRHRFSFERNTKDNHVTCSSKDTSSRIAECLEPIEDAGINEGLIKSAVPTSSCNTTTRTTTANRGSATWSQGNTQKSWTKNPIQRNKNWTQPPLRTRGGLLSSPRSTLYQQQMTMLTHGVGPGRPTLLQMNPHFSRPPLHNWRMQSRQPPAGFYPHPHMGMMIPDYQQRPQTWSAGGINYQPDGRTNWSNNEPRIQVSTEESDIWNDPWSSTNQNWNQDAVSWRQNSQDAGSWRQNSQDAGSWRQNNQDAGSWRQNSQDAGSWRQQIKANYLNKQSYEGTKQTSRIQPPSRPNPSLTKEVTTTLNRTQVKPATNATPETQVKPATNPTPKTQVKPTANPTPKTQVKPATNPLDIRGKREAFLDSESALKRKTNTAYEVIEKKKRIDTEPTPEEKKRAEQLQVDVDYLREYEQNQAQLIKQRELIEKGKEMKRQQMVRQKKQIDDAKTIIPAAKGQTPTSVHSASVAGPSNRPQHQQQSSSNSHWNSDHLLPTPPVKTAPPTSNIRKCVLFVSQLPPTTGKADLSDILRIFGDGEIIQSTQDNRNALVKFSEPRHASNFNTRCSGMIIRGIPLRVAYTS